MVCPGFETKDDIYCYSLAKALYYVRSPVTVGFYASWGRRKDFLLNKIESYLCLEGWKKDQEEVARTGLRTRKTTGKDLIKLIFLMIFHHPVITETHKQRTNIRYCFIRFSAWEYAGSDHLWAGLVTTLCDGIENCFGLAPISVYRAVGKKIKIIDAPLKQEWVNKKILCIPLWVATLMVIFIGIAVGALILIFGFPFGDLSGDLLAAAEGVGATVVGISAAGVIRVGIVVIRNAVVTQKGTVQQKMNRTDMSSQLGFMNDVKREVKIITRYLQLMEVYQRQKIRVVLEITNLDKCMPDKVVGVLNAMNILLSDPNAPFISILAVDPSIIVECVESSLVLQGMANNGYQFLNRIITLPFCIPKMDCDTKLSLLRSIIEGKIELIRDTDEENSLDIDIPNEKDQLLRQRNTSNINININDIPMAVRGSNELELNSYFVDKGPKTKTLIDEALGYLFDESMSDYITDNAVHIRRMVNTITISIRLMIREVPRSQIQPRKVTEWVLLATQWPCRLSWILQCVEDEQQNTCLAGEETNSAYSRTFLWDVFEKSLEELDAIKTSLKQLLELDGDPEIFHHLLCENFTVEDANFFLPYTVNLDPSIKRQMELLRGSNNMWESKKSNRLTMLSLLNMSVDEVCKEMNKLGFREKNIQMYKQKIKDHNLNGRALVYSDNNDIKNVMGMGLGDWTLFSVYFLGVLPPPPTAPATAPVIGKQEAPKLGAGSKENMLKESRISLYLSDENF
ncbi:NTPase KAP family P-loop domain-containing protein 1-like [Bufo bufo]|uniref:NTPase KAP family P-loop domain-containing protein 1-like n=1 Tax=Bufo bufo TaxID=8384 RepID=UPI001ABEC4F2|nr:NTPase KAP family P-loop domain-containing protein 1-like [Bufo bufo]XP_040298757.1 NTPase KAP family P-loop domain-containing protein 1-like [Bufo bufo]